MKQTRNLWPWAIIFVFVVFISGTISLVVMACSQKIDLVSADYYEQEIKFQRHIDQVDHTRRLAKDASVTYDSATRRIRVALPKLRPLPQGAGKRTDIELSENWTDTQGPSPSPLQEERAGERRPASMAVEDKSDGALLLPTASSRLTGQIQFYRPSAAGLDRRSRLETNSEGIQYVDVSSFQRGLWKVRISWTVGKTDYFLDQSINLGG
jgi:hypothetical protein